MKNTKFINNPIYIMQDMQDHIFTILLLGDRGVGKSILSRMTEDSFTDETLERDLKFRWINFAENIIKLRIHYAPFHDKFRRNSSPYHGAHGVIVTM